MKSVVRSLRVLEAIAEDQPVSVAELSRRFELPKSTVQRTLTTLASTGWIRTSGTELTKWEIAPRILAIRPLGLQGGNLQAAAREPMRRLRDATNETVHLSVPDDANSAVLVDRLDCNQAVRTFYPVGEISPMHATSIGQALLAHLPEDEIARILGGELTRYSDATITDPDKLRAELARVRERGYALNMGMYRPAVCSIASAVLDQDGRPVAGLCISMPETRYAADQVQHWAELVQQAASEIAVRLHNE